MQPLFTTVGDQSCNQPLIAVIQKINHYFSTCTWFLKWLNLWMGRWLCPERPCLRLPRCGTALGRSQPGHDGAGILWTAMILWPLIMTHTWYTQGIHMEMWYCLILGYTCDMHNSQILTESFNRDVNGYHSWLYQIDVRGNQLALWFRLREAWDPITTVWLVLVCGKA